MKSLVSVVMPMYNSQTYVLEAIQSVQKQTYSNWELIIVDDGSSDQSIEIVSNQVALDTRIKLLKNETNLGAALSRNKAILASKGSYIAFLDADDLWLPNKLEQQINVMQTRNADVCFSSYQQIDEKGNQKGILIEALPLLAYKKLLKSNYVGNLTGIYNAKVLGKITSPNLRKRQDWLIWLKALELSEKPAIGIKEPLALYRVRDNSISSNKLELVKHNYWVYKKGLGFTTFRAFFAMLVFLKEHFFVKSKLIKNTTL